MNDNVLEKKYKVKSSANTLIFLWLLLSNVPLFSQTSAFFDKSESDLKRILYNESADSLFNFFIINKNQQKQYNTGDDFLVYQYQVLVLTRKQLYDRALTLVNKMAVEAEKSKDKELLYRYHFSAGVFYAAIQQTEAGNDNFQKALGFASDSADVLSSLSSLYSFQENYIDAVKTAQAVLRGTNKLYQSTAVEQARFNLAKAYMNLDSTQKAEEVFKVLSSAGQFKFITLQTLALYAKWKIEKKDFKSSIQLSFQLLSIADSLKYQTYSTQAHILLSKSFSSLKKVKEAEFHLLHAKLSHSQQPRNPFTPLNQELYLLEAEYDFYHEQLKYKEALVIKDKWALLYKRYSESRANSKLPFYQSRIYQLELENELTEKKAKLQRQRNLILFISFILLSTLVISLLVIRYLRKSKKLKESELFSLQKEQEYMAVKSMLEGRLAERERIGREIHDDLGASLTSISLLTEVLKKRVAESEKIEVVKISELSAELIGKLNDIIWALNDQNDSLRSLTSYLRKFADGFLRDAGIILVFHEGAEASETFVDGIKRRNIYLVIKEALHNIVKHSNATQVIISVQFHQKIIITIEDNGVGFSKAAIKDDGNGLRNMKSRMSKINGSLELRSVNGTFIEIVC
jgi:signal transduction histidine kinase